MGGQIVNFFVIMAFGVMLADMIAHSQGTTSLFNGMARLWQIGVNGMLGQATK